MSLFSLFGRRAQPPRGVDALLTGIPRSGTTLCCRLLNELPGVLALDEPLDPRRLIDAPDAVTLRGEVTRFIARTRRSVQLSGVAKTRHVRGKVPDNHVADEFDARGDRRRVTSKERVAVGRTLPRDFTLLVKHPATFTACLEALSPAFRVFAIIRNPLSILCSWNSVPFSLREGRAPAAERLAPDLAAALHRLTDVTDRQFRILDWYFDRYARYLPPCQILRYEDVIATRGRILAGVVPGAATLDEPLRSRNGSSLYERDAMMRLGERMLRSDGAWRRFYAPAAIENLLAAQIAQTA